MAAPGTSPGAVYCLLLAGARTPIQRAIEHRLGASLRRPGGGSGRPRDALALETATSSRGSGRFRADPARAPCPSVSTTWSAWTTAAFSSTTTRWATGSTTDVGGDPPPGEKACHSSHTTHPRREACQTPAPTPPPPPGASVPRPPSCSVASTVRARPPGTPAWTGCSPSRRFSPGTATSAISRTTRSRRPRGPTTETTTAAPAGPARRRPHLCPRRRGRDRPAALVLCRPHPPRLSRGAARGPRRRHRGAAHRQKPARSRDHGAGRGNLRQGPRGSIPGQPGGSDGGGDLNRRLCRLHEGGRRPGRPLAGPDGDRYRRLGPLAVRDGEAGAKRRSRLHRPGGLVQELHLRRIPDMGRAGARRLAAGVP
jgi:hypothetical protein